MNEVGKKAELLVRQPVRRADLAPAFEETSCSTAHVLVEGRNFYPAMLEDIAGATSSIHVNQFGFRPGKIGDTFASALLAKAADGVSVRLVVDLNGSDPEAGSRPFYDRLLEGGVDVCVVRAPGYALLTGRWRKAAQRPGTSPNWGTSIIARS